MTTAGLSDIEIAREQLAEAMRRAGTLRTIVELFDGGLSLESLLHRVVEGAADLLGADHGGIGLTVEGPAAMGIRPVATFNVPSPDPEPRVPATGLAGRVLAERRPVRLDRYGDAGELSRPELAGHAAIGVPIWWSDRIIGVLGLTAAPPRRFDDEAVNTLTLLARHAAIAIENARLIESTGTALDEARLLYQTSQRMSAALDVDAIVRAYLEGVAAHDRFVCSVALYEFDEAGERTAVVVRGRWSPEGGITVGEERIPHTRDAFDPHLDEGRTVTITDFRTDPRVSPEFRRQQRRRGAPPAIAMLPLMAERRRIGLVILSHPVPQDWYAAAIRSYQVTAAQLAAAIDGQRQRRLLADRDRRLAVLEERQRLARELHDAVIQSVFGVSLIAQSVRPALRRDPTEAERRIDRLIDQSLTAVRELRMVVAELHPPPSLHGGDLDDATALPASVTDMVGRLVAGLAGHGLEAELDARTYLPQPPAHERALYRIVQEAVSNIVKHARARRVTIRLATEPAAVCLLISDDGVGFQPGAPRSGESAPSARSGGFGLTSMRGRVAALGGMVNVRSAPGRGTTIEVTLPVGSAAGGSPDG